MKIALFVSSQTSDAGGSYTFESQLLEALLELNSISKHTFIVYVSGKEIPARILDTSAQIVSLHLTFQHKINLKILVVFKAIICKLQHLKSQFLIKNWHEQYIVNLLKADRIDVILSFTPNCPTLEYPYIATVWDLQHKLQPYFPEVSTAGEWDRREKFYTKMLSRAAFIITGTETGKSEIERFYQIPTERIKVIPFFTPQFKLTSDLIDRDLATKYHLPDRYLFYPAQFWPHKNHVGLLLAIKCLKEKYDLELSLVLVGADKGNESHIRSVVKDLDLSKQVHLLGFVPQSEMASLYRNAFALVFMSFFGPDNLPPLEAMALGCPVIAANVSGAKEQLGDAALLVDPKQPEEIACAINSLFKDSVLRQKTIESGLKRANQWTAKDYVKEIFSLIDDFEAIRRCWE
jgi:glycosyltransferase involved in cell wall biosynthesis